MEILFLYLYLNDLFKSNVNNVDIPGQRQLLANKAYLSSSSQIR